MMLRRALGLASVILVVTATGAGAQVATLTINKCAAGKIKSVGKSLSARARCYSKQAQLGVADAACHEKASTALTRAFQKLEAKYSQVSPTPCLTFGDRGILEDALTDYAVGIPSVTGSASGKCDPTKIRCVGKYVAAIAGCASKGAGKTGTLDPACVGKAQTKLANDATGCLDKAAAHSDCTHPGNQAAALRAAADAFAGGVLCGSDPGNPGCPTPVPTPSATPACTTCGTTERVSLGPSAEEPTGGDSLWPALSADGNVVAFESLASNLVPGDTNGFRDVFVYDRVAGATERVSVATDGSEAAAGSSFGAGISADGRFVGFTSYGLNFGLGTAANVVLVRDRQNAVTEHVSVASDGSFGGDGSTFFAMSGDGRFVVFATRSPVLVSDDTNDAYDVFVRDRATSTTERVSLASDGSEGNGESSTAAISADGRFVAFYSKATNLVANDDNGLSDIFLRDRLTGMTRRMSVASDGTEADGISESVAISGNGRFVAFDSYASNLVAGDDNEESDVFVHDRITGDTECVSVASDGTLGNSGSYRPSVSEDGRWVAFSSYATNLVAGDSNGVYDVFVHDRQTGATERVSRATNGTQSDGHSYTVSISASGRWLAFDSYATSLIPSDANGVSDVFLHDREGIP